MFKGAYLNNGKRYLHAVKSIRFLVHYIYHITSMKNHFSSPLKNILFAIILLLPLGPENCSKQGILIPLLSPKFTLFSWLLLYRYWCIHWHRFFYEQIQFNDDELVECIVTDGKCPDETEIDEDEVGTYAILLRNQSYRKSRKP